MSHCRARLFVLASVAGVLIGSAVTIAAPGDGPKLDPALRLALEQATDATKIRVIVHSKAGSITPVKAHIQARGNEVAAEHAFINAVTADLRRADIEDLEADAVVDHISLDAVVQSTGAPQTVPIYGRIPASQRVRDGTYSDTITVTVQY